MEIWVFALHHAKPKFSSFGVFLIRRFLLITPLVFSLLFIGSIAFGVQNSAHANGAFTVPTPISLYKFDEITGATTITDSIRGAAGLGTLYGSPTYSSGKVGNALCLNGSTQYATAPLVGNGLTEFTLSAWVYLDNYTNWATIVKNWGSGAFGTFHFGLDDSNGKWSNYVGTTDPNRTPEAQAPSVIDSSPAKTGSWQYLVTTYSSSTSTMVLYVNGTEVAKNTSAKGTTMAVRNSNGEAFMSFGVKLNDLQNGIGSPPGWLDGCLDEIAFWNVALSEAQVDSIIDNGGAAPSPFTITYDANTGTGSVPAATTALAPQTVLGNTGSPALTKPGFNFNGWNTQADGTGLSYNAGDSLTSTTNLTLYAQWQADSSTPSNTTNDEQTLADTGAELHSFDNLVGAAAFALFTGLALITLRHKKSGFQGA